MTKKQLTSLCLMTLPKLNGAAGAAVQNNLSGNVKWPLLYNLGRAHRLGERMTKVEAGRGTDAN